MAFLMTDMAAGSNAARTLQQNVYGAQYDEANTAAAAEQNQLKTQQDQLNVEKTKLSNLVADTGFKASESSKAKLRTLAETPEFKAATDAEKLRLSAAIQFQNADVENGVKTLTAAELYDSKELANKQKVLDQQAQIFGNTFAVLDALKTPEQRTAFFKEMETQQPEQYQNLIKQIGPNTFEKMSSDDRHAALKGLMFNASGQLKTQLKQNDIERQILFNDSRERIERIKQDGLLNRKLTGGTDREMRDWNLYNKASENIDRSGKKTLDKLNENVEAADLAQEKSKVGLLWNSSEPSEKAALAYRKAVEARDKFQQEQITKQINLATTAPDFPGKQGVVDNLMKQLELFPESTAPKEQKPEGAKPAAKAETTAPAKPSATSNKPPAKLTQEQNNAAITKANEAIKNGADPEKVKARLKEAGVSFKE
jgi:hypothetical protein